MVLPIYCCVIVYNLVEIIICYILEFKYEAIIS